MSSTGIVLRFPDGLRVAPVGVAVAAMPANVVRFVPRGFGGKGPGGPTAA